MEAFDLTNVKSIRVYNSNDKSLAAVVTFNEGNIDVYKIDIQRSNVRTGTYDAKALKNMVVMDNSFTGDFGTSNKLVIIQ